MWKESGIMTKFCDWGTMDPFTVKGNLEKEAGLGDEV